jgi:hypothetical protein
MPSNFVVKCIAIGNKVLCQRNGFAGGVQISAIIQTATGNQRVTTAVVASASGKSKSTPAARPRPT